MGWTDYIVKRDVDELKDLTFEQANKVAEMLNEREVTAKIDDLEERLYDSEQEYGNLEDDYNNLKSVYDYLEDKAEEIKENYSKLMNFFINLEASVLKTRKLTDDIELSNYCDVIVNKFNKFMADK
jgi:predicted nuclease with TOPRIM domain